MYDAYGVLDSSSFFSVSGQHILTDSPVVIQGVLCERLYRRKCVHLGSKVPSSVWRVHVPFSTKQNILAVVALAFHMKLVLKLNGPVSVRLFSSSLFIFQYRNLSGSSFLLNAHCFQFFETFTKTYLDVVVCFFKSSYICSRCLERKFGIKFNQAANYMLKFHKLS